MNAVEIEEAVSKLVEESFNAAEFSYAFLEAFGNKTATLQRLRNVGKNSTNKTDVAGDGIHAVLQRNNIHIATCSAGGPDAVASLLKRLVDSPASSKHKAKFALATDGNAVHAECLNSEEPPLVCEFKELADHFGYFLELAGISTVRQIRENAFDIKATGRLNRLYVELLRNNPDWDGDERREELNHFFARLIFCFFAEDTGIFNGNALFTETVRQMSDPSGENTDFVLSEIFRAMDVPTKVRDAAKLRPWAGQFPYVNGGLFGSHPPSGRVAEEERRSGEGEPNQGDIREHNRIEHKPPTQRFEHKSFRRENRKHATKSEGLLWSVLRANQVCDLKFRRQHSIENWIVDFACVSKRLVVEIDGGYHDQISEEDLAREQNLQSLGWDVIRFTDKDVEEDAEAVANGIANHLGLQFEFKGRRKTGSGMKSPRRVAVQDEADQALPARSSRPSHGEGEVRTVPKFTQIARSYLLHIGSLDWTQINPDIFGSMIQAVADDEERGALGMHYTSVPNILKVLNPLFLDDLHAQLKEAGKNPRKLLNLRKRLARIRVFDPACGSGNFLVIAYKEMRKIEAEINILRGEPDRASEIPLTNFRGIELRHFAVEIARLALIIAEYQCDELYRGQRLALAEFLPLNKENWITHGNALRLDWLKICPPTGTGVKLVEDDLFQTPLDQTEIDFENEGGETYICGNPPYSGKGKRDNSQLDEMKHLFGSLTRNFGYIDYVGCWFLLASKYIQKTNSKAALVATNSICQGRQLPQLWPHVLSRDLNIAFAHHSFKWSNNAANNAGVICVIIGIAKRSDTLSKAIYDDEQVRVAKNINAYLIDGDCTYVESRPRPLSSCLGELVTGSVPNDDGNLILEKYEARELLASSDGVADLIHPFFGSRDYLQGMTRSCLVISDAALDSASRVPMIAERLERVRAIRLKSVKKESREKLSRVPHRFQHVAPIPKRCVIIVPSVSAESREWFPAGVLPSRTVVSNLAFMLNDVPLWNMAILSAKLHLVWIGTVCGKLKTDYRYSNTLGWNTFPVPPLSDESKMDLTRCAENILLAREAHWPATIAELYEPESMPDDLRAAHDRNDETLERIYIGRRFKNDTERLETLFQLYTEMTSKEKGKK